MKIETTPEDRIPFPKYKIGHMVVFVTGQRAYMRTVASADYLGGEWQYRLNGNPQTELYGESELQDASVAWPEPKSPAYYERIPGLRKREETLLPRY